MVAWSPGGAITGGTGLGLRIASEFGIPVLNLDGNRVAYWHPLSPIADVTVPPALLHPVSAVRALVPPATAATVIASSEWTTVAMRIYTEVAQRCRETDLYVGHVPGFRGAHTQGGKLGELNANLREVYGMLTRIIARFVAYPVGPALRLRSGGNQWIALSLPPSKSPIRGFG